MTLHDLPWPSLSFFLTFMPFVRLSMIMCLIKPWSRIWTSLTQAQINSHWTSRLDPIDTKSNSESTYIVWVDPQAAGGRLLIILSVIEQIYFKEIWYIKQQQFDIHVLIFLFIENKKWIHEFYGNVFGPTMPLFNCQYDNIDSQIIENWFQQQKGFS